MHREIDDDDSNRTPTGTASRPPILLFSYFYPPDAAVGAMRPHRLAKYLSRLGFEVAVIAAGEKSEPQIDGQVTRVRGDDIEGRYPPQLWEKVARKFLIPNGWGAIWSIRAARYARQVVASDSNAVVLSSAPPLATHFAAMQLCRRYQLKWIADFRDPFVGDAYRQQWLVGRRGDPWLERQIFGRADVIVANTDTAADSWRARYPEHADKIHLIWNGFDPEDPVDGESNTHASISPSGPRGFHLWFATSRSPATLRAASHCRRAAIAWNFPHTAGGASAGGTQSQSLRYCVSSLPWDAWSALGMLCLRPRHGQRWRVRISCCCWI